MERLRRAVRGVLGYKSPIYGGAARAFALAQVTRSEGPITALRLSRLSRLPAGGRSSMSLSALSHPITLRHGSQDPNAIIDTVVRREYGRGWEGETPTTMIDAGAYIGDTSAYFLSRFPALQVVALEPDPSNLELAKLNLSPFGARVAVRHNALNGVRGTVHLAGAELGAHISADGIGEAVEAVTVPDVMAEKGWDRLDLLKMDIEGAEAAVLSDSADAWLHRVQRVVLEPHGAAVEAAVRHRLTRNGFQIEGFRSLLYATRPR